MSSIKSLVIILIMLMFLSFFPYMANTLTEEVKYDSINYAIKTATLDATSKMIDIDKSFDGSLLEYQNVELNIEKATDQFLKTFYDNMVIPQKSFKGFSSMNVPLSGIIAYRCILGRLSDGSYVVPYSYTYTVDTTIYNFTLGTKVYRLNSDNTETEFDLETMGENFFSPTMTNIEFRNYVVIEKINQFLTTYSGREYNLVAENAGTGFMFTIAQSDFSSSKNAYNIQDAIIDGVGFYAIVDILDSQEASASPRRIFTFGGAELLLKSE